MEELKVVESNNTAGVTQQYIVVRLGEEQYGVDIRYIDNIVRMQKITRVPKVASYLKGVINLRGEVIPIMSLRLKMFLPEDEITKATRIIILKLERVWVAFRFNMFFIPLYYFLIVHYVLFHVYIQAT